MRPSRRLFVAIAGIAMTIAANATEAQERTGRGPGQRAPVAHLGDQAVAVPIGGVAYRLPVFADRSIDAPAPGIRRVVIVLHGQLRNADVYLQGMVAAVREAGVARETMVVAPQFLADIDAMTHALDDTVARWSLEGWKEGAAAVHPAAADPVAASSFAAFDALVARFADRARYPDLATLVIAGHSAGGQVLARWVPTSRADEAVRRSGVAVRYVIANPSSWLYFDARRPDGDGFATPEAGSCPGWNDWKYGVGHAVPYAAAGMADIVPRFLARDLVILLGGADDDPQHPALDKSCMARLQGPHRLGRGRAYAAYLAGLAKDSASHHRLLVVPGVGHDNRRMFGSACGRAALFGTDGC